MLLAPAVKMHPQAAAHALETNSGERRDRNTPSNYSAAPLENLLACELILALCCRPEKKARTEAADASCDREPLARSRWPWLRRMRANEHHRSYRTTKDYQNGNGSGDHAPSQRIAESTANRTELLL